MANDTDFLNVILDNLDEGLLILSPRSEVLLFNAEMCRIHDELNWSHPEVGIPLRWGYGAPVGDRFSSCLREALTKKTHSKTFVEFPTEDGTLFLGIHCFPVIGNDVVRQLIVFFRDVTTDKVFERRLTEMASNLTTLIERASAVIIGTDSRGYITDWNKFSKEVTGYSKSEVFAKKFADVLTSIEYRSLLTETHRLAIEGNSVRNREMPIISKSGKQLTLLLSATLRSSRSGKATGVIFVGQDITELIEYRESLEKIVQERTIKLKQALQKEKQAVDARSKFVSMVSHEFKNPLATISGHVENLDQSLTAHGNNAPLIREQLDLIKKQIAHMRIMVEEVLDIEKGETPTIKPVKRELSVSQFTSRITEEVLTASRGSHQINVKLSLSDDTLISDEKLLRNIFLNLLNNAIKFSPGQSKVEFHISEEQNDVVFEVIDEGLGIPIADQKVLFEPFHRSGNVDHIAGTGLGLSIVKRAVDVLNGNISVVSEVGVGSKFRVLLPRKSGSKVSTR